MSINKAIGWKAIKIPLHREGEHRVKSNKGFDALFGTATHESYLCEIRLGSNSIVTI